MEVVLAILRPALERRVGARSEHLCQRPLLTLANKLNLPADGRQHPHILPLLDSGEADGFLYYVMPYVDGDSLRDRLVRQGELPVPEAVKLLCEIVDALAYAHAHGVVHRDIKPDNVMLSGRHALVMDFGVAKAVSEATGRQSLTTAGVALGTPAYMAPEQASADPHLDHRVDIYAVGAMAYELLAGRPPFTAATPQQVLAAHVTQAPEPITAHRASISPALAAVESLAANMARMESKAVLRERSISAYSGWSRRSQVAGASSSTSRRTSSGCSEATRRATYAP
ncbi:MAG TPA: serine/threonine-protein kinase [Gemmatimonadales bacterium]|nr:serine/threonine-protein kinase [Gemmatimonadales bacterium]